MSTLEKSAVRSANVHLNDLEGCKQHDYWPQLMSLNPLTWDDVLACMHQKYPQVMLHAD